MPIQIRATQAQKDERTTRADALLQQMKSRTPAQIEAYIDANVNNLAQARDVLKLLAKAVVLLLRHSG